MEVSAFSSWKAGIQELLKEDELNNNDDRENLMDIKSSIIDNTKSAWSQYTNIDFNNNADKISAWKQYITDFNNPDNDTIINKEIKEEILTNKNNISMTNNTNANTSAWSLYDKEKSNYKIHLNSISLNNNENCDSLVEKKDISNSGFKNYYLNNEYCETKNDYLNTHNNSNSASHINNINENKSDKNSFKNYYINNNEYKGINEKNDNTERENSLDIHMNDIKGITNNKNQNIDCNNLMKINNNELNIINNSIQSDNGNSIENIFENSNNNKKINNNNSNNNNNDINSVKKSNINISNDVDNTNKNKNNSYYNNCNDIENKNEDSDICNNVPKILISEVNEYQNGIVKKNENTNAWEQFKEKKVEFEKILNQSKLNTNIEDEQKKPAFNKNLLSENKNTNLSFLEESNKIIKSPGSFKSVPCFKLDRSLDNDDTYSVKSSISTDFDDENHKHIFIRRDKNQTSAWKSDKNNEKSDNTISIIKENNKLEKNKFDDNDVIQSESAWKVYSKKTLEEILSEFDINQVIGKGFNGTIFKGTNKNSKKPIAIKAESSKSTNKHLEIEYAIYQRLFGVAGMPKVLYYGSRKDENIMIMELLGPSIESLFNICNRSFTTKTVCMMGKQLLTRLEMVHKRGIVYRDIKPENFMIGFVDYTKPISNTPININDEITLPPVSTIYLADFGLSEFYRNELTGIYLPNILKPPCGTPRYMSLNTHKCCQQTPRDDIEALGYCLIYFLYGGTLPWMGVTASTPEKMIQSIGLIKKSLPLEQLLKKYPMQFKHYLEYVRKLDFYDMPDYNYLKGLLDEVLQSEGETDDGEFDWIPYIRSHQKMEMKKLKHELEKNKRKNEANYMKKLEKFLSKNQKDKDATVQTSSSIKNSKKGMKSRLTSLFNWNLNNPKGNM